MRKDGLPLGAPDRREMQRTFKAGQMNAFYFHEEVRFLNPPVVFYDDIVLWCGQDDQWTLVPVSMVQPPSMYLIRNPEDLP